MPVRSDPLVAIPCHVSTDDAAYYGANRCSGDTPVTLAELVSNDTAGDRAHCLPYDSISDVVLDCWLLVVAGCGLVDNGDFAIDDPLAINHLRLLVHHLRRLINDGRRRIDDLGLCVVVLNDDLSPMFAVPVFAVPVFAVSVFAVPVFAVIVIVPTAISEGICAEDGYCYDGGKPKPFHLSAPMDAFACSLVPLYRADL